MNLDRQELQNSGATVITAAGSVLRLSETSTFTDGTTTNTVNLMNMVIS